MLVPILITIVLTAISVLFLVSYFSKDKNKKKGGKKTLTLWNECNAKSILMNYVKNVTNENSPDFIKQEDRIAIFDLDGTLFQETDPVYFDFRLYKYRVLDDPTYKDKATEHQKDVAHEIEGIFKTRIFPEGIVLRHAAVYAEVFKGMTVEEADKYVKDFCKRPSEGYNNLKVGDGFYKPMLEVIEYLQDNDFIIYIVSGSDRFTVRSLIEGHIDIPKNYVIGTEARMVATHQGDTDGFIYTFRQDDVMVFEGKLIIKDLYMNKVHNMIREIGQIPVLSFGNSGGDSSVANYVLTNKKYKGLSLMLLCDDVERENGDIAKANKFKATCEKNGWIPVSMKNDWKTIYGENVTRKHLNKQ